MNILVIDAQGGGIGRQVVSAIRKTFPQQHIVAVGQSRAKRILIPVNHCDNHIAGTGDMSMAGLIESVVGTLRGLL